MIEVWTQHHDKGNLVGAVLMNLSKRFDTINHGLFLAKLEPYGQKQSPGGVL